MDLGMFIIQFLVLMIVVCGTLIFFLKKLLFDSTQGAVNRLNRETEEVRAKQSELNEKVKEASEELNKRRKEADELVSKMTEAAELKAREEREKIIKKARRDSEEIINKAQRTKEDIRQVLKTEVEMKMMDFVSVLLSEVLSEKAQASFNNDFIDEFLNNLEEVDMDMIKSDIDAAEVTVASSLDEKLKNKLSGILQKKLGRTLDIKVEIDKSIISGILVRFGNLKLDGGLAKMLQEKGMSVKEKIEKGLLEI